MLRTLVAALLSVALACGPAIAAEKHKLALQISDYDPDKMNAVLNVAANVSKFYSDKGEEVDIQIVAFNAGLHMLRDDTSPVKPRLKSFKEGMPNVSFMACENTLDAMTRKEGKEPALVDNARRVKAGVVTLIELGEKGWTIVRP
jgi:intracellular sulfur oxidation DsrE/DsrF family protein